MALNQALAEEKDHCLLLVGLPCQALAAASMKAHPRYPAAGERLALVIGLFCTWNLPVRGLRALLQEEGISGPVEKYDIPPPPAQVFWVKTPQGEFEVPLDRVREKTLAGCALCPDMTAELSDISVGALEGRPGWNTVLVRTLRGAELLAQAQKQGLVLLEPAEEASLEHLRASAQAKRRRAQAAWRQR
jgi:coenzyme F420 hydrogenase subunit beta